MRVLPEDASSISGTVSLNVGSSGLFTCPLQALSEWLKTPTTMIVLTRTTTEMDLSIKGNVHVVGKSRTSREI